jgi:hypothetical protein
MFCKLHCKHDERILPKHVSRQGNDAKKNAATGSGSVDSYTETTGEAACFNFRGKEFDAERIAANKSKWEEVLCKCRDAFPALYAYA